MKSTSLKQKDVMMGIQIQTMDVVQPVVLNQDGHASTLIFKSRLACQYAEIVWILSMENVILVKILVV